MGQFSWYGKHGIFASAPYEFEPTSVQDLLDVAKLLIASDDVRPWLKAAGMHQRLTVIDESTIETVISIYGEERKWGSRDAPLLDISIALARRTLAEDLIEPDPAKAQAFIADRIYHRRRSDSAKTEGNEPTLAESVLYAKYLWNDSFGIKTLHGADDWPETAEHPRPVPVSDRRRREILDWVDNRFRTQYGLHKRNSFSYGVSIVKDFQFGKIKSLDDTSTVMGKPGLRYEEI